MLSEKMVQLGTNRSVIRDLFEYGNKRKAEIGAENVFDFSIGNPSVPAPECVKEAAIDLLTNGDPVALHGYTSAQGDAALREKLASYVNEQHSTNLTADNFYVTVGAAASLTISLKALAEPDDEFITFAPFFPEYRVFVEMTGSKLVVVPSRKEDFQIDTKLLEDAITEHTKGIILNSPNNPSGVVLTEECIKEVCAVLEKKQKEYGKEIFLIADEPYRELVYSDVKVPYLMNYYDNTIVCYSYSKSLSLPGERIGYIAVSDKAKDDNRNNVVKSSNVGNADISRGSLENNALNKIIIESAIFNANNKSSKKSGTGIIKHKIGTKINAPNTISSRRIAFPPLRFFYQNQLTFPCNPYT